MIGSLVDLMQNERSTPFRSHMLIGKERHDIGRPNDWGYPVRGIRTEKYLFLINFKPERWPAGNPETGYLNCDGSPTKSVILHQRRYQNEDFFWNLAFGKRPAEELYDLLADPHCMNNLVGKADYSDIKERLKNQLLNELKEQQDPRAMGNGDVFDNYTYAHERHRNFYERFQNGEITPESAGWVNEDDFEKSKLD